NNCTTLKNMICSLPDLAVTKSVNVPCATLGTNLTYTILGKTLNSVAVTGVVISDKIPANTTYVSSSDNGSFDAGTGTVTFPAISLDGNSTAIRTVTVAVAASVGAGVTEIDNTAMITDDHTHGVDSNPDNNTFTLRTP